MRWNLLLQKLIPLIKNLKKYGNSLRVGTNHGSLSDRLMNRYGDTPEGMVESAMEFLRICKNENYHEIVLSMKSSNPIVMVEAYRLLANCMDNENICGNNGTCIEESCEYNESYLFPLADQNIYIDDTLVNAIPINLNNYNNVKMQPR